MDKKGEIIELPVDIFRRRAQRAAGKRSNSFATRMTDEFVERKWKARIQEQLKKGLVSQETAEATLRQLDEKPIK